MKLRVERAEEVADGVRHLWLAHPDGELLPPWEPGAHLEVQLPGSLLRHYSLCGSPQVLTHYEIAVLHTEDSRGGSRYLHQSLAVGEHLECTEPRNHFMLDDATEYRFVAGGIGITPILPMVRWCQENGRPWSLLYCGRSLSSMAFQVELSKLEPVTLVDEDLHGRPDLVSYLASAPERSKTYVCGPAGLISAVRDIHEQQERTADVHWESFTPGALVSPGTDASFEVTLQSSGRVVEVGAAESVLEAVRSAGLDPETDCEVGICGTCVTQVIDGEVDHRDFVIAKDERATVSEMMICVSRAKSASLVLDL